MCLTNMIKYMGLAKQTNNKILELKKPSLASAWKFHFP